MLWKGREKKGKTREDKGSEGKGEIKENKLGKGGKRKQDKTRKG